MAISVFLSTQLISCRLPKRIALYFGRRSSPPVPFRPFFVRWIKSRSESLCRGLGSRWFTERFHRNALVAHFQHGQVLCAAWRLENYAVARCRLHQRAPQG